MSQQLDGSNAVRGITGGWRVRPQLTGNASTIVIRENFLGLKELYGIRLVNLASRISWFIPFDFDVAFFTFDIAQGLLVLVEPFSEHEYSTGANVHLHHLPANVPDTGSSLGNSGPLLCRFSRRPTQRSSHVFGEVQIAGDVVGIIVSSEDLHENGETVVSVWNWKTDTQLVHLSNELFTNFIFMNTRRILVSHRAFSQIDKDEEMEPGAEDSYTYGPTMLVYDLDTQKLSRTGDYRCAFSLGPYTNRPDKTACYLRSDPSALRGSSDSQQPEFLICSCEHLLVNDGSLDQSEASHTPDPSSSIEDQTSPTEKYGIDRASCIKKYIFATDLKSKIEGTNADIRTPLPSKDWLQLPPRIGWAFGFMSGTRTLELFKTEILGYKSPRIGAAISDLSPEERGVEGNGRSCRRSESISHTNIAMNEDFQFAGFITNGTAVIIKMLKVPAGSIGTTYVFEYQPPQPWVSDSQESLPRAQADNAHVQRVRFP